MRVLGLSRFSAQKATLSSGPKFRRLYLKKLKGQKAHFFSVARGPVVLVNAVKSLPPSPKVGATGGPKVVLSCDIFKKFSSCGGPCAKIYKRSAPSVPSFCTGGCPLAEAVLSLGQTPDILPPGAPGRTHPKKCDPQLRQNFRGEGQNFKCVRRGPPSPPRDKILGTVPWPSSPQKNSKVLTKFANFSSYRQKFKNRHL